MPCDLKNPRASATRKGISLFHARLTKTIRTFFFSCASPASGCARIPAKSTPKDQTERKPRCGAMSFISEAFLSGYIVGVRRFERLELFECLEQLKTGFHLRAYIEVFPSLSKVSTSYDCGLAPSIPGEPTGMPGT